jgi:hypothetical protein
MSIEEEHQLHLCAAAHPGFFSYEKMRKNEEESFRFCVCVDFDGIKRKKKKRYSPAVEVVDIKRGKKEEKKEDKKRGQKKRTKKEDKKR